jgi:epoxyqueuosine reductase
LAGFEVSPDFERFDQMNDMFTRAFWDETVRSADTDAFFAGYRMDAEPRRGEGFSQKDFALRKAVWLIRYHRHRHACAGIQGNKKL